MPIIQQLTLTTPKLGHKYYMYQVYCTTASYYYTLHIIHEHTVVAEGCTHAEGVRHGGTTLQLLQRDIEPYIMQTSVMQQA